MKAKAPVTVPVVLVTWLGVQACITDNDAQYRMLDETLSSTASDDDEDDDANVGGTSGDDDPMAADDTPTAPIGDSAPPMSLPGDAGNLLGLDGGPSPSGSMTPAPPGFPEVPEDSPYYPPCYLGTTIAGEEIKKFTACTPEDVQLCHRPCGPKSVGWKTELCLAGVYAEGDCTFPEDGDYSCFAIPDVQNAACPTDLPPKATAECDVPECSPCNLNGQYYDTANNAKPGFCICREPDEFGVRTWTCASDTAWPCPFGRGC